MSKVQIAIRPIATATGERGRWSLWAHGATLDRAELPERQAKWKELGYQSKILPL